jgi:hypothetical protein
VDIEPALELHFEGREFAGQFARVGEQPAHLHECPHYEHTHLHGAWAVEHLGRHDRAMLGEGVRQVFNILPLLHGHNL